MISITFKKWFCNVNIRVYFEKLDKCIIIIGKYSQQLQLLFELVYSSFLLVQQGQVQHLTGSSFSLSSYSFNFINGDRHRSKILIISHYLSTIQLPRDVTDSVWHAFNFRFWNDHHWWDLFPFFSKSCQVVFYLFSLFFKFQLMRLILGMLLWMALFYLWIAFSNMAS